MTENTEKRACRNWYPFRPTRKSRFFPPQVLYLISLWRWATLRSSECTAQIFLEIFLFVEIFLSSQSCRSPNRLTRFSFSSAFLHSKTAIDLMVHEISSFRGSWLSTYISFSRNLDLRQEYAALNHQNRRLYFWKLGCYGFRRPCQVWGYLARYALHML